MITFDSTTPSFSKRYYNSSMLINAIEDGVSIHDIEPLITTTNINEIVKGKSPLQAAILKGNVDAVRLLVQRGADTRITGTGTSTCYYTALKQPNAPALIGALGPSSINVVSPDKENWGYTNHWYSPFEMACRNKNLEAAMALLDQGARASEKEAVLSGMIPLIERVIPQSLLVARSIEHQGWEAAEIFLQKDPEVRDIHFERAIQLGCPYSIVEIQCKKHPDFRQRAFDIACEYHQLGMARCLHATGCTIDEGKWHANYDIPIMEWIATIHPEFVNRKNDKGQTQLFRACQLFNVTHVESLIRKCKASVDPDALALIKERIKTNKDSRIQQILNTLNDAIAAAETLEDLFGYDLHPSDNPRPPEELVEESLLLLSQPHNRESNKKIIANAIRLLDNYHYTILDGDKKNKTHYGITNLAQSLAMRSYFPLQNRASMGQWHASFPYDPGYTYKRRPKHPEKQKLGLARFAFYGDRKYSDDYIETRCFRLVYEWHKRIQLAGFADLATHLKDVLKPSITPFQLKETFLLLKYLAKYYGIDPDNVTTTGYYSIVEHCVETNTPLPHSRFYFNEDGTTNIYNDQPLTPQLQTQAETVDASWVDKPWTELSTLQQRHMSDAYSLGIEAAQNAQNPTPGQKRLLQEYARYKALQKANAFDATVDELFTALLEDQWDHLVAKPERMQKLLYNDPTETTCPLIVLTEVPNQPYAWVAGHTAHLINGYSVSVDPQPHPQLASLLQGRKKLTANELQSLITKLHGEKIPCVVLAQKGTFSTPSTSTSNPTGITKGPKNPAKAREPKERTTEPKPKKASNSKPSTSSSSEEATEKSKSSALDLLMEPETFETGDFLQDMALHLLENARFSLFKRTEKQALYAGDSWKEVALAAKVEQLPRKARKATPILAAKLKPYQKEAVCWIREWTDNGIAGLLAADAGLGKTLTALELIFQEISKFQDDDNKRTVLVLCKKSLVAQWEAAFTKEIEEAKNTLEAQIAQEPIETWIARLETIDLYNSLRSSHNQKMVLDAIKTIKETKSYTTLYHLLYNLVRKAAYEGQSTLLQFLAPLKHIDQRQVYLAAQFFRSQVVAKAETSQVLSALLKTKPRVVITTPGALNNQPNSRDLNFSWVIIDEADQITDGVQELQAILDGWRQKNERQKRLLITATPIRNSITDVWELFGLVNGKGPETQEYVNQMLVLKDAFMKGLTKVTQGKQVDEEELFKVVCRLHQRIRYLRETIAPITYTARRNDPSIIEQWQGRIPTVNRTILPITLNDAQNSLLEQAEMMKDIFTRYQFESKLKQHPDFIMKGATTLIDKKSDEYAAIESLAKNNPDELIARSPLWKALFDDLAERIKRKEKCVIVGHHIIPQELLKLAIAKKFEADDVLVESISGDTQEDIGSILTRFKSEKERPGVMLLINKSGGAGLDFPDATATYMLGEEWNDAAREQIEARIIRVGVAGVKHIVYFNADLLHEKHMIETSKMKNLWAKLALSKPPVYAEYARDIEEMLLALQAEFTASVQNGKLLPASQVEQLGQFVQRMVQNAQQEVSSIYKAYVTCRPNALQPHPYYIAIDAQNMGLEIPVRGSYQEAVRFGALILSKKKFPEPLVKALQNGQSKEEPCDMGPMLDWFDTNEKDLKKQEELNAEELIFSPDGTYKQGYKPAKKEVTLRILELPNGKFSPLFKIYVRKI